MDGAFVEAIFITPSAGQPMQRVSEVEAVAGSGLAGDRYSVGTGYYCPRDVCEVTMIEGEALDRMSAAFGVAVHNGEHRRNIVTRGLALRSLDAKRLRIGKVL